MSISNLNPFRLTKLYSDAKLSANNVANAEQVAATAKVDSPEYQALQRKFRIQKDRLVTWGLQWSDEAKEQDGIDESIAQAGLTENVRGIMSTINEILEEVERMRTNTSVSKVISGSPLKIVPFDTTEEARDLTADEVRRCEDLCRDLSSCIDVLYELSRSRRALQEGTYPIPISASSQPATAPEKTILPPPISKALFSNRSFSSSGETLVTPSRVSTEKTIAVVEAPPKLSKDDLVLPQEPPPSYSTHGNHAVRMVGHLKRPIPTATHWTALAESRDSQPVIVEYAFFDPTYRETGVRSPPTEKLDAVLNFLAKNSVCQDFGGGGTLNCLGWFEDLDYSRYGVIYELPRTFRTPGDNERPRDLRPTSLISILQSASKTTTSTGQSRVATGPIPALEERYRLAHNVLRAALCMHANGTVMHRNLCSTNILFFTKILERRAEPDTSANDEYELTAPYLVGFDLFADYDITSDDEPQHQRHVNIYQHPDTLRRNRTYRPEYDAYSLGLLLLEVGLWIPLSDLWKAKYSLNDFRNRLEAIWVKKLAAKVGSTYMNVVKDLLAAASSRRTAPAGALEGAPRLKQTYGRSLERLRRCCMIDEAETLDTPMSGSMQNLSLEAMVQQGTLMEQKQAISRWSEKTQLYEEPVRTVPTPTINLGLISQPLANRFSDAGGHNDATAEHQYPHTLPIAIEEAHEESLSRRGSNASNARSGLATRWSFGLGSPKLRDSPDVTSTHMMSLSYQSAAQTIQRAWRTRRDIPSFQDYKRKITIIQQFWRRRRGGRQNSTSAHSKADVSNFHTSIESLENRRTEDRGFTDSTVIRITPQTQPHRKKLRIQPRRLPSSQVAEWHNVLLPRLEKILAHVLKDSSETCSIDLLCIGETPAKTKPSIFVTCSSTSRVKAALSRRFLYDRDAYDLKIRKGSIRRSKSHPTTKRVREAHRSMAAPINSNRDDRTAAPLNPFHQSRPICGASIGAYADAQHLPPVSFGGVVAVDYEDRPTELYGMTVHHLLDSPSDEDMSDGDNDSESGFFDDSDEAPTSPGAARSSATAGSSWLAETGTAPGLDFDETAFQSGFLEISDDSSIASDDEVLGPDYDSEDEDDGFTIPSHASTEGDLEGILPGRNVDSPVYVTQPAIDDVADDFFPDADDRDEDHLSSHKLGVVYASSGIRRWRRGDVAHEVDWALLSLNPDRIQPVNVVQGGRKYLRKTSRHQPILHSVATHRPKDSGIDNSPPNPFLEAASSERKTLRPKLIEPISRSPSFRAADDEYPTAIVPAESLGSLHVHCFGRTSGLKSGVIGDTMSSVRIYRRRSFSRSWHVLGGFGMGGDSGAWILDNETGRVCGHVLAFAERNSMAYICPLEIMFEDMLRVLGAKSIGLPGGGKAVFSHDFRRQGTMETDASAGGTDEQLRDDEDEELPFDLTELGIEDTDSDERLGGVVLRASPFRTAVRNSRGTLEHHDRERLMYAPGGVLSMPRGESRVGPEIEPRRIVA